MAPEPAEGEYTVKILQKTGLSRDEIDDLRVRGVVTWPD